jgi:hypothetical protein
METKALYAIIVPAEKPGLFFDARDIVLKDEIWSYLEANGLDFTGQVAIGTWELKLPFENNYVLHIYTDEVRIRELAELAKLVYEQESVMFWKTSSEVHFI